MKKNWYSPRPFVVFVDGQPTFKQILQVSGIFLALLLLVACGATPPQPTANIPTAESGQESLPTGDNETTTEGYPPPPVPDLSAAYPADGQPPTAEPTLVPGSYPPPSEVAEAFREPRFRFDLPLEAGATTVSGQAPPDTALAIADITFNGATLGSGRSDSNGRFSISVSPLPADHRIGITVAELQPGQSISDMSAAYYPHRGDGFMNLPNIGVFFETALVGPE